MKAYWFFTYARAVVSDRSKKKASGTKLLGGISARANLTVSMIAAIIYLPLIPLIMPLLGISQTYIIPYLIASMQIIETYLITMLEACLRAKMPQTIGYGILVVESCKVLLAYILIPKFQQSLIGARAHSFTPQISFFGKSLVFLRNLNFKSEKTTTFLP